MEKPGINTPRSKTRFELLASEFHKPLKSLQQQHLGQKGIKRGSGAGPEKRHFRLHLRLQQLVFFLSRKGVSMRSQSVGSYVFSATLAVMALLFASFAAQAQDLYWNPVSGGGAGNWNTADMTWSTDNTNNNSQWINGSNAILGAATPGTPERWQRRAF